MKKTEDTGRRYCKKHGRRGNGKNWDRRDRSQRGKKKEYKTKPKKTYNDNEPTLINKTSSKHDLKHLLTNYRNHLITCRHVTHLDDPRCTTCPPHLTSAPPVVLIRPVTLSTCGLPPLPLPRPRPLRHPKEKK